MLELLQIFFNVITPVCAVVLLGYVAGPRLQLEARTLSRYAYYLLIPAFVFNVISTAEIEAEAAAQMIGYMVAVMLACALLGFGVAKLLRRSREVVAAFVVTAVWANVGNFGLPIIQFHLGEAALVPATVYFLAALTVAFVVSVSAAAWGRGGGFTAVVDVLKTPALLALVPAVLINWLALPVPLPVERVAGLLGAAMVPTMLVTIGVQLSEMKQIKLTADVVWMSLIRLLGGAGLAFLFAAVLGLSGLLRGAGILQASMPIAILASIIALEYDLRPDLVTTAVLFSTLLSIITLTLLLAFV